MIGLNERIRAARECAGHSNIRRLTQVVEQKRSLSVVTRVEMRMSTFAGGAADAAVAALLEKEAGGGLQGSGVG